MLSTYFIERNTTECPAQSDDQIDYNTGSSLSSSMILSIQWSEGKSEIEHIGCDNVAQENATVPLDDMTQIKANTEVMDFESDEPDRSRTVNISYL
jgi:hypothetical protein